MPANRVIFLDTARGSSNLGDAVISRATQELVPKLKMVPKVSTHGRESLNSPRQIAQSRVAVFSGTNILGATIWRRRKWPAFTLYAPVLRGRVAFLGVGWGSNVPRLDSTTRALFRSAQIHGLPIGVRDSYTWERAAGSGLDVSFIGCPTMVGLSGRVPRWDGISEVVTTLTDYDQDPAADTEMLAALSRRFDKVHLWLQGSRDGDYLRTLEKPANLEVVPHDLAAYTKILHGRGYIGTRLHGGIAALQRGCPVGVIAVDHRATTIGKDTGLPVVERRRDVDVGIDRLVDAASTAEIRLPDEAREEWLTRLGDLMTSV